MLRSRPLRAGVGGAAVALSAIREGVWRVDVEIRRDPVTGRRRRVSRQIRGSLEDAELARSVRCEP
jgi:hypothetical protein